MNLDSLNGLTAFVRVAQLRSFTLAAERLGISPSGASKAVSRLEERLGVRLFKRTTRSVTLTGEGEGLLERVSKVLADLEDAESAVVDASTRPVGKLRLLMPVGFGRRVVLPVLHRFARAYPDVELDVELSDRVIDPAEEGLDAALRIGALTDSRLIAVKLCEFRFVTVAAPEYWSRRGPPQVPTDLYEHACLAYLAPQTGRHREWEYVVEKRPLSLRVAGQLHLNNAQALTDAAVAGLGVANVASFLAYDQIKLGRLALALQEFTPPGRPVWLLYPRHRQQMPRLRVLVDWLREQLSVGNWWDEVLTTD
jgi:LysR family transcriptional regulator for bpeEF and oprC